MKAVRHTRIKEIVTSQNIETQEELADALRRQNIDVTQATVSRDIKELMLIKVPSGDGHYRYAYPAENTMVFFQKRMAQMFSDFIIDMDCSENLIVVKTLPGAAGIVASTIDCAKWEGIIGTVAGDDTILVVVKPRDATEGIMNRLASMIA